MIAACWPGLGRAAGAGQSATKAGRKNCSLPQGVFYLPRLAAPLRDLLFSVGLQIHRTEHQHGPAALPRAVGPLTRCPAASLRWGCTVNGGVCFSCSNSVFQNLASIPGEKFGFDSFFFWCHSTQDLKCKVWGRTL